MPALKWNLAKEQCDLMDIISNTTGFYFDYKDKEIISGPWYLVVGINHPNFPSTPSQKSDKFSWALNIIYVCSVIQCTQCNPVSETKQQEF